MIHRALALAVISLSACVSAVMPRTGDVVPGGKVAFEGSFNVATVSPGEAHTSDGREHTGNAAFPEPAPPAAVAFAGLLTQTQLGLRYGVSGRCELGGLLGAMRVAAEARCAVLDEDRGAPLSIAASAAVGYHPFFDRDAAWGRVGIDVSRRFRTRAPIFDLYASYGPEAYSLLAGSVTPADPDDLGPAVLLVRREARVTAALGFAWFTTNELGRPDEGVIVLSLAPYAVIWADDPDLLSCRNCGAVTGTDFTTDLGIALLLTIHRFSPEAYAK